MFAYHSIFLCRARSNFGYSLLRNICCGYVLYFIACLKCCLIFSLYVLFFFVMKCIISKVYEIRYSCMCQYRSNMKSFVSSKFFLNTICQYTFLFIRFNQTRHMAFSKKPGKQQNYSNETL